MISTKKNRRFILAIEVIFVLCVCLIYLHFHPVRGTLIQSNFVSLQDLNLKYFQQWALIDDHHISVLILNKFLDQKQSIDYL